MPSTTQIVVKVLDERWTIGREGWPFQSFDSREQAVRRAQLLVKRLRDAKLVIEQVPPVEQPARKR